MLVSIIVPMYNVEDYLKQCLDSLKNQTLKDYEVILVNDGSTDQTRLIASEYVSKYPEIFRLLDKENGGLSDARNYGIPYAKGEYIAFLDSDDFVEENCYEMMAKKMDENTDVVVCDIEYWYTDASKRFVMKGLSDTLAQSIQKQALLSPMFAWNKLYRASLFTSPDGYRYPLHTWYEDNPVTSLLFAKAKGIGHVDQALIHYRQREGSIMSNTNDARIIQIFDVMKMIRDEFEQEGLSKTYHDELEYLHIEHLRLYGMFRFIRSNEWKKYYQMSEEVMKQYYPNWKKNPYIKYLSQNNRIFLKCYNRASAPLFHARIR